MEKQLKADATMEILFLER
jgi:hypothetical protein